MFVCGRSVSRDHMSGSLVERRGLVKDEASKLPSHNLGFCRVHYIFLSRRAFCIISIHLHTFLEPMRGYYTDRDKESCDMI